MKKGQFLSSARFPGKQRPIDEAADLHPEEPRASDLTAELNQTNSQPPGSLESDNSGLTPARTAKPKLEAGPGNDVGSDSEIERDSRHRRVMATRISEPPMK